MAATALVAVTKPWLHLGQPSGRKKNARQPRGGKIVPLQLRCRKNAGHSMLGDLEYTRVPRDNVARECWESLLWRIIQKASFL